jgi:hypothetical protein
LVREGGVEQIDLACIIAYTEGMKSMQYTIRSVPPNVDQALRRQARRTGKSLNEVAIEALAKGSGASTDAHFDDLDWFIGSQTLDARPFDNAVNWLDELPKEL